jgi:hypothetical protein
MKCVLKSLNLAEGTESQVRRLLGRGHSLSRKVAERLAGARMAHLATPPDYKVHPEIDLSHGGVCSQEDTLETLSNLIHAHLRETPNGAAVFEAPLARPGDESLWRVSNWGWLGNEVYYFLAGGGVTREAVSGILSLAMDPLHFLCVLTRDPGDIPGHPFELTPDDLRLVIDNSDSALMGIFDGESFLQIPLRH